MAPITRGGQQLHEALQKALQNRAPLSVVQEIVQKCPEILTILDEKECEWRSPLHKAIGYGCTADIILYIAETTPKSAVRQTDPYGYPLESPVHLILKETYFFQWGGSVVDHDAIHLLKEMARMYGEDLLVPVENIRHYKTCDLPLHYALRRQLPLEAIQILCENGPAAVREKNGEGDLPLYVACKREMPDDDVMLGQLKLLVSYFPESALPLEEGGPSGPIPDLMQDHNGGPKSVRFLLEQLHPSLREPGKWLPVQTAFEAPASTWGYVYGLARLFPETLSSLDEDGSNALHYICRESSPEASLVEYVSWAGAGAVRVQNQHGDLPLHMTSYSDPRLSSTKTLIEAYPEAICIPDNDGALPLHLACSQELDSRDKNQASQLGECIRYLADLYPNALRTPNTNGFLPLHLGCKAGMLQGQDIEFLVESYPVSVRTPLLINREIYNERWLPVFLAAVNQDSELDSVFFLMHQYPEAMSLYRRQEG